MPATTTTTDRERWDTTTDPVEPAWADPQWVRREFTELIEATYPSAAAGPARAVPPRRSRVTTRTLPAGPRSVRSPRRPDRWRVRPGYRPGPAHRPARQRSPPTVTVGARASS